MDTWIESDGIHHYFFSFLFFSFLFFSFLFFSFFNSFLLIQSNLIATILLTSLSNVKSTIITLKINEIIIINLKKKIVNVIRVDWRNWCVAGRVIVIGRLLTLIQDWLGFNWMKKKKKSVGKRRRKCCNGGDCSSWTL